MTKSYAELIGDELSRDGWSWGIVDTFVPMDYECGPQMRTKAIFSRDTSPVPIQNWGRCFN